MNLSISKYTSLNFATYVKSENIEFWTSPKYSDYVIRPDDMYYVVTASDRIDLLAYRFYGNAELWQFIAHVNNLYNLPSDLKPGLEIRIPSKQYVISEIVD